MIKWLVLWTVVNMWMNPCDHGPMSGYDEYGRRWEQHVVTLEMCYDHEILHKEKYFDTYEEALAFVETGKAKSETWSTIEGQLRNWEIKKVITETVKQREVQ